MVPKLVALNGRVRFGWVCGIRLRCEWRKIMKQGANSVSQVGTANEMVWHC